MGSTMSFGITRKCHPMRCFLSLMLICCIAVPAVVSAGPDTGSIRLAPDLDLNISNTSFTNPDRAGDYAVGPTPVDIFRTELNQSTLPGPRYMGFGPSTIGISIDPRLLAICFAIVLIGLVIWFVSFHDQGDDKGKGGNAQ